MKSVVFIGNFDAPHSTENELKWTFEKLGWKVHPVQENLPLTEQIYEVMGGSWAITENNPKPNLLLYVHTHGWGSAIEAQQVLDEFKTAGITTASFHLDRYWGLNIADRREELVGDHPFWHTDHVFTADGGNQERFAERGVNHHWVKPGVVERDCYLGTPRDDFKVDVAFVGSRYYHPEYPQRAALVGWLQETYKDRFRRFAGDESSGTVRGKDLNDLYASVKVVVGDSCFAGQVEKYWSDRVAETTGRGGFLIHPHVEGLDHLGIVRYEAGNMDDLKSKIDYYLEHDEERERIRRDGYEWTCKYGTYTDRLQGMLTTMKV